MDTRTLVYDFRGHIVVPATASSDGSPFVKAVTGAAPPTAASAGGKLALALTSAEQAQNMCVYWGDDLGLPIADIRYVRMWAGLSVTLTTNVQASFGLASARNDTIGTIANRALFRVVGAATPSKALKISSDDGTHESSDVAANTDVAVDALRRYDIDFASGLDDVRFHCEMGPQKLLRRVRPDLKFDLSAQTGGFQPYFQIQKASSTEVGALWVARMEIDLAV